MSTTHGAIALQTTDNSDQDLLTDDRPYDERTREALWKADRSNYLRSSHNKDTCVQNPQTVSNATQNFFEYVLEFIRDVSKTHIGEEYSPWVPFIGTWLVLKIV